MRQIRLCDARSDGRTPGPVLETRNLILDSTLESADKAERAALETAKNSGLQAGAIEQICLAVREIATNAVIHGNRSDLHKKLLATILRTRDALKIIISDEGTGFDPEGLRDPLSPEGLLASSGRGVFLARTIMDEFYVQRDVAGWTTVTMVKYFNP
jgi:anti-sigma regulatory factor (Ser/Thr protein kinase)